MSNSPIHQDSRNALDEDRALQADPELDLSGGRASIFQIVVTAVGSFAIIMLVLYGLNHQRDETASPEGTQAAAQAPAEPPQPPQKQTQDQPSNQPANAADKENAPQEGTTGTGSSAKSGAPATGRGDSSQQGAPTQTTSPGQKK